MSVRHLEIRRFRNIALRIPIVKSFGHFFTISSGCCWYSDRFNRLFHRFYRLMWFPGPK